MACLGFGLKGRTGIFEILVVDEEIQKLIEAHAPADQIRALAKKHGMRTLYEEGQAKIQLGITTQEELERVIRSDELP